MAERIRVRETIAERIWSKIERLPNGCWQWTGALSWNGYARLYGAPGSAHRYIYELLVEPVPSVLDVDHLCRNRACVNPTHMEPVSRSENMRRGDRHIPKTHCVNGHEWTDANTIRNGEGQGRRCRECSRLRSRRTRDRARQRLIGTA